MPSAASLLHAYPGPTVTLPLRRSVRKTVSVLSPLALQVYVTNVSQGQRDFIYLSLELENTTTSPFIDYRLNDVHISLSGCLATRFDDSATGEVLEDSGRCY